MIEHAVTWLDGFMTASNLILRNQSEGWFSPETIPSWASFGAAALSAFAALAASSAAKTANRANALQAMSNRRLEILRISSENVAELLIMKDRFTFEMEQAKIDAQVRLMVQETNTLLNSMITSNENVIEAVFMQDKGDTHQWDDHIRSTLKKKQQITHVKAAIDLKISEMKRRSAAEPPPSQSNIL